jgi:hypothetical protein
LEQRRWDGAGVGVALIRDGNGTRTFETLMRYRAAAIAELMRALRTLKALQAGQGTSIEQGLALGRTEHRCDRACALLGAAHFIRSRPAATRARSVSTRGDRMGTRHRAQALARLA